MATNQQSPGGQGPIEGVHAAAQPVLSVSESAWVDDRQDELMKKESPEGRPPKHEASVRGWRRLLIGLSALVIIAVVWSLLRGVQTHDVIGFAVATGLVLILGAWPVLTAGLLRGKEETKARHEAIVELRTDKLP